MLDNDDDHHISNVYKLFWKFAKMMPICVKEEKKMKNCLWKSLGTGKNLLFFVCVDKISKK
mgnify:CR=1 FL=1